MSPRDHSDSRAANDAIAKAAANWIVRCDRGLAPKEAEQFARWENEDPRHVAELARLSATWSALNTADEIPEVMRLAREFEDRPGRHARRSYTGWPVAAGLAAAIVIVGWIGWGAGAPGEKNPAFETGGSAGYQVVASTARRLTLADGTTVELNGDSVVEPAFTGDKRLVRLLHGEANFNVVRDPARPFVVQAGNVAVQAIGTAFNVLVDPVSVHVLVTEGRVRVDDVAAGKSLLSVEPNRPPLASNDGHEADAAMPFPLLGAGERVIIPTSAKAPLAVAPSTLTASELDRATAWQATQLVFNRTSLKDAVAAFNSFNQRQLVLGDPALGRRMLGGAFRADNVDAFIWLLETGFDIRAEMDAGGRTVLRSAH